jgi:hypothetical protein
MVKVRFSTHILSYDSFCGMLLQTKFYLCYNQYKIGLDKIRSDLFARKYIKLWLLF